MKLGIMQPYFIQGVGYFEMINRTDTDLCVRNEPEEIRNCLDTFFSDLEVAQ